MDIKIFCKCGFEVKALGTHMASDGCVFVEVEPCKYCAAEQCVHPTPESLSSSQAVINADNLSRSGSESNSAQARVIQPLEGLSYD
jgi:hypothetical protein